ncbi:MAG: type II toxin-antitoxin system RelE/ParE family toxin [Pseudonocardia sp.]
MVDVPRTPWEFNDPRNEMYTERYTQHVASGEWQIYIANEVRDWLDGLDMSTHSRVVQAIDTLAEAGPGLGRPLVDTIHGSSIANLKELRPGTVRILFAFDPWRSSILLVAGDKSGEWNAWYRHAIPLAEQRYERYLKEHTQEEEHR